MIDDKDIILVPLLNEQTKKSIYEIHCYYPGTLRFDPIPQASHWQC